MERVASCCRSPIPKRTVDIIHDPAHQRGFYAGLKICASVWMCPVCAAKITERRRLELAAAVSTWRGRGDISLVTLTLQHSADDPLEEMLDAITEAAKRFRGGKSWQALMREYAVVGIIRALEVTHGESGWHPHMHLLVFHDTQLAGRLGRMTHELKQRWSHVVAQSGRYASYDHGCDVRHTNEHIADYIAKFGREPRWTESHELTKAPAKKGRSGGRTPTQLLADYAAGDKEAGMLWRVYALLFTGKKQLVWSRGLRDLLGLNDEKTDEEVATEQSQIAILLAHLEREQWRAVVGNDARGELQAVADSGDVHQVVNFLADLGIELQPWQIPLLGCYGVAEEGE